MLDDPLSITVDIVVEDNRWHDWESLFQEIANHVLKDRHWSQDTEITFVLTNNEHIQELNRDYREKDKPTNVLSFPNMSIDDLEHLSEMPEEYLVHLGDVVISFDKLVEESEKYHKSFEHHLIHLTIHGILHLLGYDHIHEQDATIMQSLEINLLKKYNIQNPYEDYDG